VLLALLFAVRTAAADYPICIPLVNPPNPPLNPNPDESYPPDTGTRHRRRSA
jgi:hypothetical protein